MASDCSAISEHVEPTSPFGSPLDQPIGLEPPIMAPPVMQRKIAAENASNALPLNALTARLLQSPSSAGGGTFGTTSSTRRFLKDWERSSDRNLCNVYRFCQDYVQSSQGRMES